MIKDIAIGLLSILVLAGFSGSAPKKYEYMTEDFMYWGQQDLTNKMNFRGEQGWEFCGRWGNGPAVFKRMK